MDFFRGATLMGLSQRFPFEILAANKKLFPLTTLIVLVLIIESILNVNNIIIVLSRKINSEESKKKITDNGAMHRLNNRKM